MLSLLSIPIAAVISMVLGMLWYSPVLFGNQWMKLMGLTKADFEKKSSKNNMTRTYSVSFVMMLLEAFVVRLFLGYIQVRTFPQALIMAFWIWLGFMVPIVLNTVLYGGKNAKLFWLDAGYQLVVVSVMALTVTFLS